MTRQRIQAINSTSFTICLLSILHGVIIAALRIWNVIPTAHGILWRALATCGVLFAGSVCAAMAIGCFKTNE